jgi:hypothetical protein
VWVPGSPLEAARHRRRLARKMNIRYSMAPDVSLMPSEGCEYLAAVDTAAVAAMNRCCCLIHRMMMKHVFASISLVSSLVAVVVVESNRRH